MFQKSSSAVRAWLSLGLSERSQTLWGSLAEVLRCWWVAAAMMNERPECLSMSARHSGAISDDELRESAWLISE